jgi:hypothetical protein
VPLPEPRPTATGPAWDTLSRHGNRSEPLWVLAFQRDAADRTNPNEATASGWVLHDHAGSCRRTLAAPLEGSAAGQIHDVKQRNFCTITSVDAATGLEQVHGEAFFSSPFTTPCSQ